MKKIIPIILLCISALTVLLGCTGLILTATAVRAPQIAPIGIAAAIPALVMSILVGGLCVLFKRDILCRVAFWITLAAFACSAVSIIIWLAVL